VPPGNPRLRFAPSPTGLFHVGGARSALFNWLLARQTNGTFILRVEDTDNERNREEWVTGLGDAIQWLGLDWDEYYRQSERADLYLAAADKLWATGALYGCSCTRADVEERTKANQTPGYDGFCRDRGLQREGNALRFRVPDEGSTTVPDVIRGNPVFEHSTIEDFVLVRSDGSTLFLLANVVDDVDMAISHVIRGEEHLPNTPKYLLVWDALGGGAHPVFAHLPVIVNAKRQKLSKRRPEDKVNLEDYQADGYLAEAMRNYLALLGWAPADGRELMSLEEMIAEFKLEDVNSSSAFFDQQKLVHFNGEYIRALPVEEFVERAKPWLGDLDPEVMRPLAGLVQERVKLLSEVPDMVGFLYGDDVTYDEKAWGKRVDRFEGAADILDAALAAYAECGWDAATLHDVTLAIGEARGLSLGKAQFPIRVAVSGRDVGPPLFESLQVLGRDRSLARLRSARARLG
jgi:glutamyl-tRNA synthetase